MSPKNTISSAGYLNSSTSQINSRSLSQPFDPNIGPGDTYYLCDPMATQEPSLIFSYEIHDSLLGQDPLACKDSNNSQVAQLKQQLTELQHAVASLQANRLQLINENTGLNTTCQTLQRNMIINMQGSTSSMSLNTIADEKPSLVDRIVPTESDQELDQKDYPSIKSWTRKEWQDQNPKTTSADEQGVPVSAQCTKTIQNLMLLSFWQLDTQGLTPDSISQASLQWFNYHVKKRTGKRIKAEHGESSPDLSEDALPTVQKCGAQPEPITKNIITKNDEAPTPPPHADKGKEKEIIAAEINNLLSKIAFKPRPKPITKKVPTPTFVTDSSTSGTTTSASTTTAPPSNILSDTDASSLAVKMELLAPIKKRQPSTKPMRVSPKITARNLCALKWQSNGHQREPASIFAIFWNGLSSTDKEAYKCKVVQQLQSAGLPATVDDADEE
ncbi:hypothetical protein EDB19DRAFT_1822924 [Suillus lakei]|nr:hypothetical protein EDB19DRAFT_1822924 [Suillus lakei]